MNLQDKLIQLRKRKGMSQLELAEILNVSRQAISKWELGTAVPTLENLVSISKLYGVSVDFLVDDKAESVNHSVFTSLLFLLLAGTAIVLYLFFHWLYRIVSFKKN